ncbi:MAG: penicillin-binding transpeptidase domain-containing protein [Clostridia bacterium]|nr:penicillin-binding transpeptidase domain-containing protein [Clostridia bacterium]
MKRFPYSRYILLTLVMLALMSALIVRLGELTLAQGESLSTEAAERAQSTIISKGKRGRILDRNGVVLAYSEACYNVEFLRDPEKRTSNDSALYTESLIRAIEIIEAGGGKTIDTSYIQKDEAGNLVFNFRVESESAIKARYKNFCNAMGFSINDDLTKPQSQWDLSKWPTAEFCYNFLRRSWCIPEEMSFEDAVKIISIRQEVNLNNYRAYEPITIATDVSMDVVARLSLHAAELPGIQTSQSTTRVYPYRETAAHIVGYLSANANSVSANYLKNLGYTETDYQDAVAYEADGVTPLKDEATGNTLYNMLKMGYSYTDYIGVSGIEATMEAYLTGATTAHHGEKVVEINKNGSIIREISSTMPTDGRDVMLTLDIELQKVTEKALADLIADLAQAEQLKIEEDALLPEEEQEYGSYTNIKTATAGTIVVMNPQDGTVLSMASSPSFDPNWFLQGLTDEQFEYLFGESSKDSTPMRNKAVSAKLAPGSIFKMVTGIAGISEGAIGLTETVNDLGPYYVHDENGNEVKTGAPRCWTRHPQNHHDQDITQALKNSCNYYFFTVAERLGIEKLNDWSGYFGLTSPTNIELTGETAGIVGGQAVLFDCELTKPDGTLDVTGQKTSLPTLIYNKLCIRLREYVAGRAMEIDEAAITRCAMRLMQLQDGGLTNKGPQVRSIMSEELGIPEGVTSTQTWVNEIMSYLTEIQWKATLTIRSGMGQGVTLVTPIEIARYVSSIANEGTVYDARIVDKIQTDEGETVRQFESNIFNELNVTPEVWSAVKQGMTAVVSPEDTGTAEGAFSEEFATTYQDRIAGKTGSAQVSNDRPDIENTGWFVCYGPRENPEIVVVICIPNGWAGSRTAPAAEDILTYYFDKQEKAAPENLVAINEIAP